LGLIWPLKGLTQEGKGIGVLVLVQLGPKLGPKLKKTLKSIIQE
jgi:hypothetical protein